MTMRAIFALTPALAGTSRVHERHPTHPGITWCGRAVREPVAGAAPCDCMMCLKRIKQRSDFVTQHRTTETSRYLRVYDHKGNAHLVEAHVSASGEWGTKTICGIDEGISVAADGETGIDCRTCRNKQKAAG